MPMKGTGAKIIYLASLILVSITRPALAQDELIELQFVQPAASNSDSTRTLQSLVKVQGTGGLHQDGLYLMTHFGDRQDLFDK